MRARYRGMPYWLEPGGVYEITTQQSPNTGGGYPWAFDVIVDVDPKEVGSNRCSYMSVEKDFLSDWEPLFGLSEETLKQLRDQIEPKICYWEETDSYTTQYQNEELLIEILEIIKKTLGGNEDET